MPTRTEEPSSRISVTTRSAVEDSAILKRSADQAFRRFYLSFFRGPTALIRPEGRRSPLPGSRALRIRSIRQGPPTYKLKRIKNDRLGVRMSEHNSLRESSAGMLSAGQTAKTSVCLTMIRGRSRLLRKPDCAGASSPRIPVHAQLQRRRAVSGGKSFRNCGCLALDWVEFLRFQVPHKAKHPECRNPIPVQIELIPS